MKLDSSKFPMSTPDAIKLNESEISDYWTHITGRTFITAVYIIS